MYKSQEFYSWRSVSLCLFAEPLYGLVTIYIFVMDFEWLSWGVSLLTRRWALSFIKFLIFCKYLTKTYKLTHVW